MEEAERAADEGPASEQVRELAKREEVEGTLPLPSPMSLSSVESPWELDHVED